MSQKTSLLGDLESDVASPAPIGGDGTDDVGPGQRPDLAASRIVNEENEDLKPSSHVATAITVPTKNKPFQKPSEPSNPSQASTVRETHRLGWFNPFSSRSNRYRSGGIGSSRRSGVGETYGGGTTNRRGEIFQSLFRLSAVLHLVLPSVLPTVVVSGILLYGVRQAIVVSAGRPVNGTVLDPIVLAFLLSSAAFDFLIVPIRYMISRHWSQPVPPVGGLFLTTAVTWIGYALVVGLWAYADGPRWSAVAVMATFYFVGAALRDLALQWLWLREVCGPAVSGTLCVLESIVFLRAILVAVGLTALVYLGMTYNSVIFYIGNIFGPDQWASDAALVGVALPILKGAIHFLIMRCLARSFLSSTTKSYGTVTERTLRLYTGSVLISHAYLSLPIRILILRTQTDASWIVSICCMLVVEEVYRTMLMRHEYQSRISAVLPTGREEEGEGVEVQEDAASTRRDGDGGRGPDSVIVIATEQQEQQEQPLTTPSGGSSREKQARNTSSAQHRTGSPQGTREIISLADVPFSLTPKALLAHLRTYAMIAVYVAHCLAFLTLAYLITAPPTANIPPFHGQVTIEVAVYRAILGIFIELVTDAITMVFREPVELDYRKIVKVKWHTHFEIVGIAVAVIGALIATDLPVGQGFFE